MTLPYTIAAVGAVAQMGERINRTDEVRGSSPLSSTHGAVAKLGSRLNGIEKAEGSSPSGSTLFGREATCVNRTGGFLLLPKEAKSGIGVYTPYSRGMWYNIPQKQGRYRP